MTKKEIIKLVCDLELKISSLIYEQGHTIQVNDGEFGDFTDNENALTILNSLGDIKIVKTLQGLDDNMFTAEVVIYLPKHDMYLQAYADINSYDNYIEENELGEWSHVKPKTIEIVIYEPVTD